jgi:hypothetical protein
MTTTDTSRTPAADQPGPSAEAVEAGARALSWGAPRPNTRDTPRRVWREQVLIRANELTALAIWMGTREDTSDAAVRTANADLDAAVRSHLKVAREAALGRSWWPPQGRARMERALGSVDAAEAALLARSPDDYLRGRLSDLVAELQAHLPPAHPQRIHIEKLASRYAPSDDGTLAEHADRAIRGEDRAALVEAARAASWAARREHTRLRSFRTAVGITAFALFLLAVGVALVSWWQPSWMPVCFAPQGADAVVCPTTTASTGGTTDGPVSVPEVAAIIASTARPADVAVVMLVGLAGAAVTGAAALRRMRGTSTPFPVPMTLLLLKLPTGALTAFLGLILLQGEFVPGLSALDTSGQILAWALAFGAAQQLVTGLVDKRAQSVLDSVGSAPMTADKE